jgi:hypothetical protein
MPCFESQGSESGKATKRKNLVPRNPYTLSSTYGPDPLKSFLDQLSHNEAKSLKKSFSLLRVGRHPSPRLFTQSSL